MPGKKYFNTYFCAPHLARVCTNASDICALYVSNVNVKSARVLYLLHMCYISDLIKLNNKHTYIHNVEIDTVKFMGVF